MALVDYNLRDNDLLYYSEGNASVKNLVKTLVDELTVKADTYKWTLVSPSAIGSVVDSAVLSTSTSFGKVFYLKISRPEAGTSGTAPITYLNLQVGPEYDAGTESFPEGTASPVAKLSWYADDIDASIKDWLPVSYWLNVTPDAINLVLRGDPSADNYPYQKFLVGYAYVGSLRELEKGQEADVDYNFGVTASSASEPAYTTTYGPRTGTGVTDLVMVANKIGLPYQPHYPAFYTANAFMDKMNIEGSRWNNQKHQFSDLTIIHPIDMERGKMHNVLIGDNSALYDNDKLVFKQDTTSQEMYKKFQITAPYSFLNNSANVLYCIAIRCYNPDAVVKVDNGEETA
jgi:hypothetical protein